MIGEDVEYFVGLVSEHNELLRWFDCVAGVVQDADFNPQSQRFSCAAQHRHQTKTIASDRIFSSFESAPIDFDLPGET